MIRFAHVDAAGIVIFIETVHGEGAASYDPGPGAVTVPDGADIREGDRFDGTSFSRPPAPVVVPASVTNFQARAVLLHMPSPTGQAGRTLFNDVDEALHAEGGVALQAWEYANDVTRDGALVNSLGAKLGMTAAQLDTLFVAAGEIIA